MARKKSSGDKFLDCLVTELEKAKGYGKVKIGLARDEYLSQTAYHVEQGMGLNDARIRAMDHVRLRLEETKIAKQAKMQATADRVSEFEAGLVDAETIKTAWFKGTPADKIYHALRTRIEDDPRMTTASHNFVAEAEVAERNMWQMFRNVIDEFSKNWAGIRRGSVTDAEIANEHIRPGSTGSKPAADIASAMKQRDAYAISEQRRYGVSIRHQEGDLPWSPMAAKLQTKEQFIADMKANIDWARSGAGRFIRPAERDEWLGQYFEAARTGEWDNLQQPFEYTGGHFAVNFHNDRMIQFKDGEAYAAMHEKYMDGGLMQTNLHATQKLAHNIGVVKIFGPSPEHTAKVFRDMAQKRAHALAPAGQSAKKIDKYLKRYDNMVDIVLRRNAMDPESNLGFAVNTASNLMTSAMLTQASFLSIPGDFATAFAARLSNNEPVLRITGAWLDAMIRAKATRREMLHAGHAASEFTAMSINNTRYGFGFEAGSTVTRYIADKSMRLNLMNRGFDAMRGADTRVRAMSLYEARNQPFKNLRENRMLERNGITEADWVRTAKVMEQKVYSPADGIDMFRPMDHFDTLGPELAHKWQRMFYNESRRSVIENTIEARAMMLGNTRPDTLAGALLNSFARFHGYPVTFFLSMARSIMAADTVQGSMQLAAAYGLATTMAAAMGIQAKNIWQGKEVQDMRDPEFWVKASTSGGAFSMWGDFITGGMRADTATTIVKGIGGPLVQMVGDLDALTIGSAFRSMDIGENSGNWTLGKGGVELVDFMRKYMIPETFFTAPIMQRLVLEKLQERMSPQTMERRRKGQLGFAAEAGTPYKPGAGPGSGNPFPMLPGG